MADGRGLILALETASRRPSAALLRDGEPVSEHVAPPGRGPTQTILALVDAALRDSGARLADLRGLALAIGPGSFTSLRIGVATLKGLAFGRDLPVVGVSSLEATAAGAAPEVPAGELVLPLIDARKGELYAGAWRVVEGGGLELGAPEAIYGPEELAASVSALLASDEVPWLVGEDAPDFAVALEAALGRPVRLGATADALRAGTVGRRAAPRLAAGEGGSVAELVPRYLRRAQAEVVRTRLRFEEPDPLGREPADVGGRVERP